MRLIKAGPEHSQQLIEFYEKTPLEGRISLAIKKNSDYFSQYSLQSDDHVTYILHDEVDDKIHASGTLVFRKGWISGEEQIVGYATDLRVSHNRKAILQWSNHFLPILQEEKKKRNCNYVFSIVADGQSQALNALIRPRSAKRKMPRYYLYKRFDVVSLHGRWPFARNPLNSIETRKATENNKGPLLDYISKKMKSKDLQFNNDRESILQNLERWKGMSVDNFIISQDAQNNIIGCLALWNSAHIEEFIPQSYDPKTTALKETLQFFSFFRMTRKLPQLNEALKFYYASYLLADNPDIFYSLLVRAYESIDRSNFLVYPHFEGHLMFHPARSFVSSKIQCGLYLLVTPDMELPEFLKPNLFSDAPDFDLALV